jgi:hypothetical protein
LAPANIGTGNKTGQDIAMDSITFSNYDIQNRYHNKNGLYKTLIKKGVFNDPVLLTFKTNNTNTSIGNFYVSDSLFLESILTSDTNKINLALIYSLNSFVTCLPEQNQKKFNTIYAFFEKYRTLDSCNLAHLYYLAHLCPVQDGEAVFQARTLLTQFDTIRIYNSCEFLLNESSGGRLSTFNNIEDHTSMAKVYPNPSYGHLSVEILSEQNNIVFDFSIYDISGKLIRKESVKSGSKTILDISNLESGIYFYQLWSEDKSIENGKIVIIK